MNLYIYKEGIRKVRGEEREFLDPIAELEGYENEDVALEALVDQMPDLLGTEFVVFTEDPIYITVEPPPETKYSFRRRNGSTVAAEEAVEAEIIEPEEEPAVVAVATKPRAKKRPAKKPAAKAKPKAAAKRRAGRSPFKSNPASAE